MNSNVNETRPYINIIIRVMQNHKYSNKVYFSAPWETLTFSFCAPLSCWFKLRKSIKSPLEDVTTLYDHKHSYFFIGQGFLHGGKLITE